MVSFGPKRNSMSTRKKYESALKAIQEEFATKVDELAEEIRTKKVMPVCERYRLGYVRRNGIFFFTTEDGEYIRDVEDASDHEYPDLIPVIKIFGS